MGSTRSIGGWFRSVGYFTLAFFSLLLISGQMLIAQVDEGAISGTIQDSTGAIITNAKVTLVNTDQGLTLETNTTSGGTYSFSPVKIGHYSISVTAPGFEKTTQEHLVVAVGQSLQVNVELKAGGAAETVTVSTAPPQLQTDDAAVGQVVNEQSIVSLPLNGRNFTFLAQLAAGINTPQADTRGNAASGAFTANGLRPSQNNYLLDGIDNNNNAVDFLNGTNFAVLPRSTRSRNSTSRPQTSVLSLAVRQARCSMPLSSPVPTTSMAPPGSSSATTCSTQRTIST